ncbi:hypothetical protein B0A54_04188 [Friedmanniomyces endolithicus]|uniref:Uncharacterized protein n=1 Tax=Friedmanniomyces endolithicus TaxID=329885 RepID=A0A4V5N979_9PEZI|nr:hypothetical protein B0A54_04188 [Friedmanniomyces endolithicus]
MTALNSQVANGMALWPLSLARPQSRRKAKSRAGASPSGKITLDLDNLEVISSAAERVQAWRHQIVSAEGISLVETEPEIDLHHAAREVRIAAQGLGIEEKSVRAEKEQPLRTDTQDATRQPTVDARAARLAGKVERKHAEAELRRVAAEQRKTSEETANLVLALEVQERLFRIESLETEATLRFVKQTQLPKLQGSTKKGNKIEGAENVRPKPKQRDSLKKPISRDNAEKPRQLLKRRGSPRKKTRGEDAEKLKQQESPQRLTGKKGEPERQQSSGGRDCETVLSVSISTTWRR